MFLLCPAAGESYNLKFQIPRSFFLFEHVFLLDVLASIIDLGKREFGALSVLFCCVEAARREATLFLIDGLLEFQWIL